MDILVSLSLAGVGISFLALLLTIVVAVFKKSKYIRELLFSICVLCLIGGKELFSKLPVSYLSCDTESFRSRFLCKSNHEIPISNPFKFVCYSSNLIVELLQGANFCWNKIYRFNSQHKIKFRKKSQICIPQILIPLSYHFHNFCTFNHLDCAQKNTQFMTSLVFYFVTTSKGRV